MPPRGGLQRGTTTTKIHDEHRRGKQPPNPSRGNLKARIVGGEGRRACLTPLQLETRFWGQNYLDLVQGGVQGL